MIPSCQRRFSTVTAGRLAAGLLLVLGGLLALSTAAEEKRRPEKAINVNTASVEELMKLPGVGEVIARWIVRHRKVSGPFRRVEELLVIRGISRKKFEALKPYVTVEAGEAKKTKEAKESRRE